MTKRILIWLVITGLLSTMIGITVSELTAKASTKPKPRNATAVTRTVTPSKTLTATPEPQPSTPEPSCDVSFQAEPGRGQVGIQIVLTGSGYQPGETISIGLILPHTDDTPPTVIGLPAQQADPGGMIAFAYRTENGDPTGLYMMVAEGRSTQCQASATFLLEAGSTPTPIDLVIEIEPTPSPEATMTPAMTATPTPTPTFTPVSLLLNKDPLLTNIALRPWQEPSPTMTATALMPPTPTPTVTPDQVLPGQGGRG